MKKINKNKKRVSFRLRVTRTLRSRTGETPVTGHIVKLQSARNSVHISFRPFILNRPLG